MSPLIGLLWPEGYGTSETDGGRLWQGSTGVNAVLIPPLLQRCGARSGFFLFHPDLPGLAPPLVGGRAGGGRPLGGAADLAAG